MDPNLRNLKDFLTLYNKVTELCFTRCVDTLSRRELEDQELSCVDKCVTKFARFNQNMMKVYVEVQSTINAKRAEEIEQNTKKLDQHARDEGQRDQSQGPAPSALITTTPANLAT